MFSELCFQLDQLLLLVAFILQAVASIHSETQKLRVIIVFAILIFDHQTSLELVLMPPFLTFQEFFEMSLIELQLQLNRCHWFLHDCESLLLSVLLEPCGAGFIVFISFIIVFYAN